MKGNYYLFKKNQSRRTDQVGSIKDHVSNPIDNSQLTEMDLNHRPYDYQSYALPAELSVGLK